MKEVKVGIVGLGRLGSVHAENLAFKIPGCKLVAACSLEQKELDWAKDYLKVGLCHNRLQKNGGRSGYRGSCDRILVSRALLDDRIRA